MHGKQILSLKHHYLTANPDLKQHVLTQNGRKDFSFKLHALQDIHTQFSTKATVIKMFFEILC